MCRWRIARVHLDVGPMSYQWHWGSRSKSQWTMLYYVSICDRCSRSRWKTARVWLNEESMEYVSLEDYWNMYRLWIAGVCYIGGSLVYMSMGDRWIMSLSFNVCDIYIIEYLDLNHRIKVKGICLIIRSIFSLITRPHCEDSAFKCSLLRTWNPFLYRSFCQRAFSVHGINVGRFGNLIERCLKRVKYH